MLCRLRSREGKRRLCRLRSGEGKPRFCRLWFPRSALPRSSWEQLVASDASLIFCRRPSGICLRTGTGRFAIIAEHPATRDLAPAPYPSLQGLRVAIAGAGRVGTALALGLLEQGAVLVGYLNRTEAGRRRAGALLGEKAAGSLAALLAVRPDLILLTVPDSALPQAVKELHAALTGPDQEQRPAVAHTSGAISVNVLDPLASAGCVTFGVHPLQTFCEAASGVEKLPGTAFAVTPGPRGGYEFGAGLARGLGGHAFPLADADRPLYHAAAVMASNYLVALEHVAEELFQAAGLPAAAALEAFLPLVRGAVDNLAAQGTVQALTGPLTRGDEGTVALHLEVLQARRPDALPLYRTLGLATLELVQRRGNVPAATLARMAALLGDSSPFGTGEPEA